MRLKLLFSFLIISSIVTAQNFIEQDKIITSPRDSASYFGETIDIYGNYAIAGARFDDTDELHQNPMQASGAAYILEKDASGNWVMAQKIVADDRFPQQNFGRFVAIDSNFAVVGVPAATTLVNGSSSPTGAVYVFKNNNGQWAQVIKLEASDKQSGDWFGSAVDIFKNHLVVGALRKGGMNQGAVYIFEKTTLPNLPWVEVKKITSPNTSNYMAFGASVGIYDSIVAVGAPGDSYDENGLNPISHAGSVELYKYTGGTNWTFLKRFAPTNRHTLTGFGEAISLHKKTLAVGSPTSKQGPTNNINNAGAAYVYENANGTWALVQNIVLPNPGVNDYLGRSICVHENTLLLGAPFNGDAASTAAQVDFSGSAMVYKKQNNQWNFSQILTASDRGTNDYFGSGVAVFNDDVLLGSPGQKENVLGQNALKNAGMVYYFNTGNSVGEVENDLANWHFYPNPATTTLVVDFEYWNGPKKVEVLNALGQKVYEVESQNNRIEIPVSAMSTGLYFIRVQQNNIAAMQKVHIVH